MKTLFMETTRISAEKTAAEISAKLGQAGAERVISEYGLAGTRRTVIAIYFELRIGGQAIPYRMPIRVIPVRKVLAAKLWRCSVMSARLHMRQEIPSCSTPARACRGKTAARL